MSRTDLEQAHAAVTSALVGTHPLGRSREIIGVSPITDYMVPHFVIKVTPLWGCVAPAPMEVVNALTPHQVRGVAVTATFESTPGDYIVVSTVHLMVSTIEAIFDVAPIDIWWRIVPKSPQPQPAGPVKESNVEENDNAAVDAVVDNVLNWLGIDGSNLDPTIKRAIANERNPSSATMLGIDRINDLRLSVMVAGEEAGNDINNCASDDDATNIIRQALNDGMLAENLIGSRWDRINEDELVDDVNEAIWSKGDCASRSAMERLRHRWLEGDMAPAVRGADAAFEAIDEFAENGDYELAHVYLRRVGAVYRRRRDT